MQDILLNSEFDLSFSEGDFLVGDSDLQNKTLLLGTNKGEWKENPDVGVGLQSWLLDDGTDKMFAEIRRQFTNDGLTVKAVNISNGKLNIDADY